jgi:hypothetical protein
MVESYIVLKNALWKRLVQISIFLARVFVAKIVESRCTDITQHISYFCVVFGPVLWIVATYSIEPSWINL